MAQAHSTGQLRVADTAGLVRLFRPGERVFLPGAAGEVPSIVDAITAGMAPPVELTTTFIPGLNPVPIDRLPPGTTFSSIFTYPAPRGAQAAGRLIHRPAPYGRYIHELAAQSFHTVVVHLSPPDADGVSTLGAAVEVTPIAIAGARRVFAVVNAQMPRMPKSAHFRLADAAAVAEIDEPLRAYDVGAPSAEAHAIAGHVVGLVPDGARLQIGIGKVPDALLGRLTDRRRLRLHSGLISDGARALLEAGALDPDYDHVSCIHAGTPGYLAWLDGNEHFSVRGCDFTHAADVLSHLGGLVAVNGALSVDLFGQANLEMLDGRMISAVGGAPDFSRAAAARTDSTSIVALPSVGGRDRASRIVPRQDGLVSIPRHDIDVVVTEHGAAGLGGASVMERAERLIAIAAPEHRGWLTDAWKEIAAKL